MFSVAMRNRYVSAIVLVFIATGMEWVLKILVGQQMLFFYLGAISITAVLFGVGPGVLSVLVSCLSWDFFILPPSVSFNFSQVSIHGLIRLVFFIPVGLVVAALGGSLRSALSNLTSEREFREKLMASIAHDLRNPLTTAKMTIGFLGRRADQESAKLIQKASQALDRADSLIQDFLDVSFRRSGRQKPLQVEPCNLTWLLQETTQDYEITHPGRVKFMTEVENLEVNCDRRALRRTADNLITNALKYGNQDGDVTVSIRRLSDSQVSIIVHNWGNPISVEDQEKLFLFFEPHSRDASILGWGIGLATVKALVEAHHGAVAVRSNETMGTSFIVHLPIQQLPRPRKLRPRVRSRPPYSGSNRTTEPFMQVSGVSFLEGSNRYSRP